MNVFKFKNKNTASEAKVFPKRCLHIIIESLAGSGFSIQCLKFWDEKIQDFRLFSLPVFLLSQKSTLSEKGNLKAIN